MNASKIAQKGRADGSPPRQPDYPDELSDEQLDAIRRLASGDRQANRQLLYAPGW